MCLGTPTNLDFLQSCFYHLKNSLKILCFKLNFGLPNSVLFVTSFILIKLYQSYVAKITEQLTIPDLESPAFMNLALFQAIFFLDLTVMSMFLFCPYFGLYALILHITTYIYRAAEKIFRGLIQHFFLYLWFSF